MDIKELSQLIADNLSYFANGKENKRSVTIVDGVDKCYYSGQTIGKPDIDGCFIGRLLPIEDRIKLDTKFPEGNCISKLCKDDKYSAKHADVIIPQYIKDNVRLFSNLQSLHDYTNFWTLDKTKLSQEGIEKLIYIIDEYSLDKKLFEKFLN